MAYTMIKPMQTGNMSVHLKASGQELEQEEVSCCSSLLELPSELLTFATLFASPLALPITQKMQAPWATSYQDLVDRNWQSLPAITQFLLYDAAGYRNPQLESSTPTTRERLFPAVPQPAPRSLRVESDLDGGIDNAIVATVFGWPSTGGLLTRTTSLKELKALGLSTSALDRSNPEAKPSLSLAEEDAFCEKLRCLGAKRYASLQEYRMSKVPRLGYDEADLGMLKVKGE